MKTYKAVIEGKRCAVSWRGDSLLVNGVPHRIKPLEMQLPVFKNHFDAETKLPATLYISRVRRDTKGTWLVDGVPIVDRLYPDPPESNPHRSRMQNRNSAQRTVFESLQALWDLLKKDGNTILSKAVGVAWLPYSAPVTDGAHRVRGVAYPAAVVHKPVFLSEFEPEEKSTGRLTLNEQMQTVRFGNDIYNLHKRAPAFACISYLMDTNAVSAESAQHFDDISSFVQKKCRLEPRQLSSPKIHDYFANGKDVVRLRKALIRSAGKKKWFLNV